jgi:excisionase family DNA binding protein
MNTAISRDCNGKLLTIEAVADRLAISPRAVYRLRAERRIGYVRIRGSFRFTEEHVQEFISRNSERPSVVALRKGSR